MSVINQVLVELEKRRATGAERMLPDHVRALPDGGTEHHYGWLALALAAAVAVTAAAWLGRGGFGFSQSSARHTPALAGTDVVIEKVVLASAARASDSPPPREATEREEARLPAGRLSLELSSAPPPVQNSVAPAQPAEPPAPAPLPAARVLSRPAPVNAPAPDASVPAAAPAPEAGKGSPKGHAPALAAVVDKPAAPAAKGEIEKQVRQPTPRDLSDHEYRKAANALHQGRIAEAQEGFRAALNLNPANNGARQALVALLVEGKANAEAESLLQEGIKVAPEQSGFTMTLARLQVNRGDNAGAIGTLQGGLSQAQGNPDYAAFLAALLQRQGRHEDAIEQFRAALRGKPNTGVWWLGMAMSLQAANRAPEAQEAYRRAKAGNLSPELSAFADQRLRQLQ